MEVFREQTFKYLGEELVVQPNLALLRRIKARGVHNVNTATKCINGGVDLEDLAIVHCEFLKAAGKEDATEEGSYGYLTGKHLPEILIFQQVYVMSVLPSVDFGKKPEAPTGQAPTKAPRKKT